MCVRAVSFIARTVESFNLDPFFWPINLSGVLLHFSHHASDIGWQFIVFFSTASERTVGLLGRLGCRLIETKVIAFNGSCHFGSHDMLDVRKL